MRHPKWTKEQKRLIKVYKGMRERCYNPNNIGYRRYGGRGLEVRFTKEEFIEWYERNAHDDLENPHCARLDKDGDYTLSNMHIISAVRNGEDTVVHKPNWDVKQRNMDNANKVRSIPIVIDGIKYASIKAAARFLKCDTRTIANAVTKYKRHELISYTETRIKFK